MHLSLRDFETLPHDGKLSWRQYIRYPHLMLCPKCRKEYKEYREDRSLIADLKAAYARDEEIHSVMVSKGASVRQ